LTLIIDPVLTFSTFTGSSANHFGCTATNDDDGNMFVGGTVFGVGYPTTTGAYQTTFGGSVVDMGITKFSANGSSLVYSTLIGGSGNEIPHSLVVNDQDELIILGTSNSLNYPVSGNAFQQVMNGGTATGYAAYGFNYSAGCDIVITKVNAAGSAIVASTLLGGAGNDGILEGSLLHYNYGDAFRGEVINGLNGDIVFASTTMSNDFPVTGSAPQGSLLGTSDAIVVSLNSDLSSLNFSTYLGGSSFDSGYSVQLNSNGEFYVCGGTISSDFPATANGINNTFLGGDADGFIAHISPNGNTIMDATYIGTTEYDQTFFVQTDSNDDVFVIGQTNGNYPILTALYSNANSGQFIQKLTPDLSTSLMSTTIGKSIGAVDFSISAFLVSDCDFIYLSGWGGTLNGNAGYGAHATQSSTNLLPITADAYQSSTDGSDFYLAVLGPDANTLLYATYFGGSLSGEHVDGGTSRFDKDGTVYQAVCAGCGGNSDFPSTPGAWSPLNNSSCNLGAFKFDLGSITTSLSVPQPYVCIPSSYQFNNNSSGGNEFMWDFGDGTTSTDYAPSHVYVDTGNYEVSLIVSDSLGCLANDTAYLSVDVFALDNAGVQPIDTICLGDSALLIAAGGASYEWQPTLFLSTPNAQSTYAYPPVTTDYTVIATDNCGSDTAYVTVNVYPDTYSVRNDTLVCGGSPVTLYAYGGIDYNWHPDPSILNISSQTPTATPFSTTTFYVDITTPSGCIYTDSVRVSTLSSVPIPDLNNDTTICLGYNVTLTAHTADSYDWSPVHLLIAVNDSTVTTNMTSSAYIYVTATNACGSITDSVYIEVIEVNPQINPDTTICPGDSVYLYASGGETYSWSPAATVAYPDSNATSATPLSPTQYSVAVASPEGCSKTLTTNVFMFPKPIAQINADNFLNYGHEVNLEGITNANTFYWESIDSIYCTSCLITAAKPEETTTNIFHVIDTNTCINSDTLIVILDGALYIPNTFTPNGDGINDFFTIKGKEINTFNLMIFTRWGQLLFESDSMDYQWDGTHNSRPVLIDTYIWKVEYEDNQQNYDKLIGHVNVIR
jgi:gliding motility-associated-like protein